MRRADREITDFDELIAVMRGCDVCRLALHDEPYPYILPLNFGLEVDGGTVRLYFHGADTGTKYDLIARNPNASFEMDRGHELILDDEHGNCTMTYESVIGQGRIGSTATGTGSGGGLAIYDDLFRVGDTISYVLFGSNTIPASAGGSCATGRIVNNKVNSIFNNNYGLYIDVKNGNRNYGIWSNASVIAPACIGNKIKNVYFTGSGYTIDFSQFNIFFVYANQKYSVTLPSASSVATMFGYSTLPSDFACIFTLIYNYNWGNSLVFTNIRNHNGDLASYTLAKGDSITVLCANYPSFHYQILNHSY